MKKKKKITYLPRSRETKRRNYIVAWISSWLYYVGILFITRVGLRVSCLPRLPNSQQLFDLRREFVSLFPLFSFQSERGQNYKWGRPLEGYTQGGFYNAISFSPPGIKAACRALASGSGLVIVLPMFFFSLFLLLAKLYLKSTLITLCRRTWFCVDWDEKKKKKEHRKKEMKMEMESNNNKSSSVITNNWVGRLVD